MSKEGEIVAWKGGIVTIRSGETLLDFNENQLPQNVTSFKVNHLNELFIVYMPPSVEIPTESHSVEIPTDQKEKTSWTHEMTMLLFSQYRELHELFPMRKVLYSKIAQFFVQSGYENMTAELIEHKWKALIRAFKAAKLKARSTGNGSIKFKYYDVMTELLEKNHSVNPVAISGRNGIRVEENENNNENCDENNATVQDELLQEQLVDAPTAGIGENDQVTPDGTAAKKKKLAKRMTALEKCCSKFEEIGAERRVFEDRIFAQYKQNSDNTDAYRQAKLKIFQDLVNKL